VEGTLFALPDFSVHFPQVVFSRILFYNEMLINLDHGFKRYCSRGNTPKVRYVGISRQKGNLLPKRGENRRRNKLGVQRHA
jgi:hypothetical protein